MDTRELKREFDKLPNVLKVLKEKDLIKYTELLIEYMKIDVLRDLNKSIFDLDITLREK